MSKKQKKNKMPTYLGKVVNLSDIRIEPITTNIFTRIGFQFPNLDLPITSLYEQSQAALFEALKGFFGESKPDLTATYAFTFDVEACMESEDDILPIINIVLGVFNNWMVGEKPEYRDREYRFGIPDGFEKIKDSNLHIMKLVNYKTKVDKFSLTINLINSNNDNAYTYILIS